MPHFYFDIWDGEHFNPDDDGAEFDSLEAAESEASRAAAEIGRDRLLKGDANEIIIEVRDEQRRHLLRVTVSTRVERVRPPQRPSS